MKTFANAIIIIFFYTGKIFSHLFSTNKNFQTFNYHLMKMILIGAIAVALGLVLGGYIQKALNK